MIKILSLEIILELGNFVKKIFDLLANVFLDVNELLSGLWAKLGLIYMSYEDLTLLKTSSHLIW